jgi:transposase InsO family protein
MPWRETSPMQQRLEFVREYETDLFTMTELAAQYGISRKTGYKWVERYTADGVDGLRDHSRRPHQSPQASDPELVERLMALRRRHPHWGAKKLLAVAERRDPRTAWPSRSTVCTWLKQYGFVTSRGRRPRSAPPRAAALAPATRVNQVWTTDYKGEFRTGDGVYCYPLTLRDGFSRFVLRCDGLLSRTVEATQQRFARAFAEYGLPDRMRSDNGGPFASPGLGGLSSLSVWWIRLGIIPERIAPGHPEQNGSHEQFHRVLKAETARPPAPTCAAQQQRFRRFVREYNEERPHEALDNQPPATRYEPSRRALPRRVPAVEYPGHMEVRRVASNGDISWAGERLFVATALAGQPVAFEEIDDGYWTLRFATVALARYDERHRTLHPIQLAVTVGRSASFAGSAPDLKNGKDNG